MSAIDADSHEHQKAPLQPGPVELVQCQGPPQGLGREQRPTEWSGCLSQSSQESGPYADKSLIKGIEGNSGRDALLSLEEILRSRPSFRSEKNSGEKSIITPAS